MLHGRFADPDTTPYTSLMSSPLDSTPTQKITASVTVNVTRNGAFISSDFKTSFEFCFSQFFLLFYVVPLDRSTARPLDKFILKRKLFEGPLLLFTFFLGVFCLAHTKSNLYSAFYLLHSIAQTFILIAKSFRTITLTLFGLLHCRGQSDYGILRRYFQNALKNSRDMRVPY